MGLTHIPYSCRQSCACHGSTTDSTLLARLQQLLHNCACLLLQKPRAFCCFKQGLADCKQWALCSPSFQQALHRHVKSFAQSPDDSTSQQVISDLIAVQAGMTQQAPAGTATHIPQQTPQASPPTDAKQCLLLCLLQAKPAVEHSQPLPAVVQPTRTQLLHLQQPCFLRCYSCFRGAGKDVEGAVALKAIPAVCFLQLS